MAAKASKKTDKKKEAERIPKYVDADGQWLDVLEGRYVTIAWWLPDDDDFGLVIANDDSIDSSGQETAIAVRVCRSFVTSNELEMPLPEEDFTFPNVRVAKQCLRQINAELHYWKQNKPLPDWAKTALAAGWIPPKGWSP